MSHSMTRRRWLSHGVCLAGGAALGWLAARGALVGPAAAEAADETPEERLRKLKLELPAVARPRATLVPAVRAGDMLYVSGHGPGQKDGKPWLGKVGKDLTVKD